MICGGGGGGGVFCMVLSSSLCYVASPGLRFLLADRHGLGVIKKQSVLKCLLIFLSKKERIEINSAM